MSFVRIVLFVVLTIFLIGFSLAHVDQSIDQIVLWNWGRQVVLENVPFAHAMLVAFFGGIVFGLLLLLGNEFELRRRLRDERRRRRMLHEELAAIRHLPFEEPLPRVRRRDAHR